jgi:ribosomal protein S18 acetylase RimI-like enzyme
VNPAFDPTLLSRVEDAALNASAPPQQRWLDGWLVRFSPGKAKRARCIHALAEGRLALEAKLDACRALYAAAGLPLVVRITPFSVPGSIDAHLAALGLARHDDTRVMVLGDLAALGQRGPALELHRVTHAEYAQAVGRLRASTSDERRAHAERLRASPVPFNGVVARDRAGSVVACAQVAIELPFAGLFDVHTDPAWRGRGIARELCERLLADARELGARTAYLQVDAANEPARRVYRALGFEDAYPYHYRIDPATVAS